jgi:hypothetical protein
MEDTNNVHCDLDLKLMCDESSYFIRVNGLIKYYYILLCITELYWFIYILNALCLLDLVNMLSILLVAVATCVYSENIYKYIVLI